MIIYNKPKEEGNYTTESQTFTGLNDFNSKYCSTYVNALVDYVFCENTGNLSTCFYDRELIPYLDSGGYGKEYKAKLNYLYFEGNMAGEQSGCSQRVCSLAKLNLFCEFFEYSNTFKIITNVCADVSEEVATLGSYDSMGIDLKAIGNLNNQILAYFRKNDSCSWCCSDTYEISYEYDGTNQNIYVGTTKISDNGIICYLVDNYSNWACNLCGCGYIYPLNICISCGSTAKYLKSRT
jgi:hypothetical protein